MKAVFLYTELADYTLACLRALKRIDAATELLVVHYPVNPEAPFQLQFDGVGQFISLDRIKTRAGLLHIIAAFQPDIILCSGWANKWYLNICRNYHRRIPTVLTMDNHWDGRVKQRLLALVAKFSLHRVFSCCWVPGERQVLYAKKLGFLSNNIFTGFYCCDLERFNKIFDDSFPMKKQSFPKRFICAARYIPAKNYSTLWNAFIRWREAGNDGWELWCAGTGSDYESRIEHSGIRHFGFVHPNDWAPIISQTGVFILPSLFEPWGVVVQEFAASGFPLVLSENVGASTQFLSDRNGFSFDPQSEDQLIEIFNKVSAMPASALLAMGEYSHVMANRLSLEQWAETIKRITQQHTSNITTSNA